MSASLLPAALGGSLQLLTLSTCGAVLAHLSHFSSSICSNVSNSIYKVFLPALVFTSVVHTTGEAISQSALHVVVPVLSAVGIFLVTALVTWPIASWMSSGKCEEVKRVVWLCLVLGNSNTLALLAMDSVCEGVDQFRELGDCLVRSTAYASLYITVVTAFSWTVLFQYLRGLEDSPPSDPEATPLLSSTSRSSPTLLQRTLFSPPLVALVLGFLFGAIPLLRTSLTSTSGIAHAIFHSLESIGSMTVTLSSCVVGAELYRSLSDKEFSSTQGNEDSSYRFGNVTMATIAITRLIVLPWIGRQFDGEWIAKDALLRVFVMVEWSVPTANNAIIMVSIVAENMGVLGKRLRRDVSTCLLWQYLMLPIMLTINTMLALGQVISM